MLLLIPGLFTAVLLGGEGIAAFRTPTKGPADAIARGERLELSGDYEKAIELYLGVLSGNESDVLWRISRTYIEKGMAAKKSEQEPFFDRAIEFARKAVRAAPDQGNPHAALASALGKKALYLGGKKLVDLSKEIKEEAEKAIALDPNNPIAHIVLGIWHREVANLGFFARAAAKILYGGLPAASKERAVILIERAMAIDPAFLSAYYELGVTRLGMGEKEKARELFQEVLKRPKARALDDLVKSDAREALKEI